MRAYYRRLEREADLVKTWSPYRKGAKRPPFDFDLSYNYYPGAFDAARAGDQALPAAQLPPGRGPFGGAGAPHAEGSARGASRRRLSPVTSGPGEPG